MSNKKKIEFFFRPNDVNYAVEKEIVIDGEKKKGMFLQGIASGEGLDAHNERMSQKCIRSFMDQAKSKEILLYPFPHGVEQGNDFARLVECDVDQNGDWNVSFALYDGSEGAVQSQVDKARVIWNQATGTGQYKKKTQFGFSIEGIIPEEDGIIKDANGINILDKVELDGVISTPRPAYQASVAEPVFKALGLESPNKVKRDLQGALRTQLEREVAEDDLWKITWRLREALEESTRKIMTSDDIFVGDQSKRDQLETLFDEYKTLMIDEIMKSQKAFEDSDSDNGSVVMNDVYGKGKNSVAKDAPALQKELENTINKLIQLNKEKNNG